MPQDEQRGEQVADTAAIALLSAFVREHRVCWEVLPELLPVPDEQPLQIGFNLELYGAHAHGTEPPHPGCEQCRTILGHLRKIAEWILPKVERPRGGCGAQGHQEPAPRCVSAAWPGTGRCPIGGEQ